MKLQWPKLSLKFPHISHVFPEWPHFSLLICGFLALVIIVNLVYASLPPATEEKRLRQLIMADPFSIGSHEKLAQYYLGGNLDEAKKEFYLAQDYYQSQLTDDTSNNLLGVTSPPLSTWNNLINYQEKIKREINIWEEFARKLPDYNYARLKSAVLYYQLGDYQTVRDILQLILEDDPLQPQALSLYAKLN